MDPIRIRTPSVAHAQRLIAALDGGFRTSADGDGAPHDGDGAMLDGDGAMHDGDGDEPRRAAKQPAPETQEGQEACERLERIAMYARAGYFNMGYTLDMMQTPGEILPD